MKLLITTKTVDENDQLLGFFVEWIRLLSKKFEKITVLCLEKGKFELPENVKVINLGKYRGLSKLRTLFSLYFTSFNLRGEYDAVFVHMNPIWMISGGALWKIMRKKCFFWYTSGGVTLKLKIAEKFADTIFTASPESFRLKSNKVIVTGHGIDTELFKPVRDVRNDGNVGDIQFEQAKRSNNSNNSIKILSVGRIAPVKNYETLIEASKILKDKGENFSVTIIGEAPPLKKDTNYKTQITNKIKELGLENNFEFLGKINHKDLPQYYQSHDIFVHLSKTGSLDKTILEAMACGMNVLSSSDSSRAFLKEELIFNEDDHNDLANKINNLRNADYGQELRDYVLKNHNLDDLVGKISTTINNSGLTRLSHEAQGHWGL